MAPPAKPPTEIPINIGNSLFVSTTGNGGIRSRLDKTFSSLEAAVVAAVTGDTIFVYPGNYSITSTLPIQRGVSFQFLGRGSVKSVGTMFSDAKSTDAYTCLIQGDGWDFISDGKLLEIIGNATSVYFNFGSLRAGWPVTIYTPGQVILQGKSIYTPDGTAIQISNGDVILRYCNIRTDATSNQDVILLGESHSKLLCENCIIYAGGGTQGTDGIGMDDGNLTLRNCKIISEGANALTLRVGGFVTLSNCEATGNDSGLAASDNITIEADNCYFKCAGTQAAVQNARYGFPKVNLRGGAIVGIPFDIRGGEITVAGTVWDRTLGGPTKEWIPGTGWI